MAASPPAGLARGEGDVDARAAGASRAATRASAWAEVHADLHDWTARYPIFDPVRFPALALTVEAYLPAARREDRTLVALVSLWIISFDALVDEGDADATVLDALTARYRALIGAKGDRGTNVGLPAAAPAEQLGSALREIGARLAAYDPPAALWAWWATSCRATIAAIGRQRALGRGGGPAPGYAEVLPLLLDSIGVRPYLAAGAIVWRDPGLTARLPALEALASECALAIRLANDLRTWKKDEREGGLNTLVALRGELTRAAPSLAAAAARDLALATLGERLAASRARCRARLAPPAAAGEIETAMVRLVDVVANVYAAHDYHTYRAGGG